MMTPSPPPPPRGGAHAARDAGSCIRSKWAVEAAPVCEAEYKENITYYNPVWEMKLPAAVDMRPQPQQLGKITAEPDPFLSVCLSLCPTIFCVLSPCIFWFRYFTLSVYLPLQFSFLLFHTLSGGVSLSISISPTPPQPSLPYPLAHVDDRLTVLKSAGNCSA